MKDPQIVSIVLVIDHHVQSKLLYIRDLVQFRLKRTLISLVQIIYLSESYVKIKYNTGINFNDTLRNPLPFLSQTLLLFLHVQGMKHDSAAH